MPIPKDIWEFEGSGLSEHDLDSIPFLNETYQWVAHESKGRGLEHFVRVAYHAKELAKKAECQIVGEDLAALLIASLAHDIQRSFQTPEEKVKVETLKRGYLDDALLVPHQSVGAIKTSKFLEDEGAPPSLRQKVYSLIRSHEYGSDPYNHDIDPVLAEMQDIIKCADSISFFECNAYDFVTEKIVRQGKGVIQVKFDWMRDRVISNWRGWINDEDHHKGYEFKSPHERRRIENISFELIKGMPQFKAAMKELKEYKEPKR